MNRKQELLGILGEECAEVIIELSKIDRFGETAVDPRYGNTDTHIERLHHECGDIFGVLKMLMEEGYLDPEKILSYGQAKEIRVEKYIKNKKVK